MKDCSKMIQENIKCQIYVNTIIFTFAPASGAVIPPSVMDKAKTPDKTTPLTRFHCFIANPPFSS